MQVISVDVPQYDAQFAAAKQSNNGLLNRILGEVHHTLRHVSDPLDLLGAFKAREYSSTAYYSGPFTIADSMTIKVKVIRFVPHACASCLHLMLAPYACVAGLMTKAEQLDPNTILAMAAMAQYFHCEFAFSAMFVVGHLLASTESG